MRFKDLSSYFFVIAFFSYGIDYYETLINEVNCTHDNYLTILQCSYSTTIDSGCTDSYDATVYCCEYKYIFVSYQSLLQIPVESGMVILILV